MFNDAELIKMNKELKHIISTKYQQRLSISCFIAGINFALLYV